MDRGGLMDYSPQSHKELDTTEQLRLLLPAVDRGVLSGYQSLTTLFGHLEIIEDVLYA